MGDRKEESNPESNPDKDGITTLATQGSITFFGSIFSRILSFLFLIMVTNLVAPSTFGVYSLALSIILFSKSILDLSIHRSVDYFIPQYLEGSSLGKARFIFGSAVFVSLLGTGISVLIISGSAPVIADFFTEPQLSTILPILAFALPLLAFRDVTVRLFIAIKELKYKVYLNNLFLPGTKFLTTGILITLGFELFALTVGYVLAVFVVAVLSLFFIMRDVTWLRSYSIERVSPRQIFSYSLPLAFAGVILTTVTQIDYFIIGYVSTTTSKDLAIYRVVTLLGNNLLIFLTSLTPIFKPLVTEVQDDISLLNARFRLAARWILIFTLPLAITLTLLAETYLSLLFTPQYAAGGGALIILLVGYLFNALTGPEGVVLEGLGYTRLTLLNTIIMVVTNTLLDFLLVPRLGIIGAAVGTAVGLAFAVIAGILELSYLRGVSPFNWRTLRVLMSGIPPLLVGRIFVSFPYYPTIWTISLPFVVLVVYLISLLTIDGFTSEDRIILQLANKHLQSTTLERLLSK